MTPLYSLIHSIVARIPEGRVATYKDISNKVNKVIREKSLKVKCTPRLVGNALHANTNPREVPCHRVVNSKGKLAKGYVFGGEIAQKKRLEAEGVRLGGNKVNLTEYGFQDV